MQSIFADLFFGEDAVRAISRTLLHSLWQGLILALLSGLVMLTTRRSSPGLRYNLLSALFICFILISGYTLFHEYNKSVSARQTAVSAYSVSASFHTSNDLGGIEKIKTGSENRFEQLRNYINEHESLLFRVWFVIFCIQFIRLMANIGYMHRIRYSKVHEAPVVWRENLRELARRMGIRQKVSLCQSDRIRVPVMAGYFKPLILFPFGMLMQLPPEQVEAVLLHELAHIHRRDYFMNILQRLAEIIFFFNPGLIWISGLIREERENCCDDMAIRLSGSSKSFIHALLAFQDAQSGAPRLAIAFPGRKNQLLLRVKRILYQNNQTLNTMEKVFLAGSLVAISFCALAFSQTNKTARHLDSEKEKVTSIQKNAALQEPGSGSLQVMVQQDTTPSSLSSKKGHTTVSKDDRITYIRGEYRIVEDKKGNILEVYQDGKRLSAKDIVSRKYAIEKMRADEDTQKALSMKMDALRAYQDQAQLKQKEIDLAQMLADASTDRDKNFDSRARELEQKINELRAHLAVLESEKSRIDLEAKIVQDQNLVTNAFLTGLRFGPVGQIIQSLADRKIIGENTDLSFELTNDHFIVNGETQPADIFNEMKSKYIKGPKDHVIYSTKKGSVHSDVYTDVP